MKQVYFIAFFLLTAITTMAQSTATLKGRLVDSVGKQSLKDASVTVLEAGDSTLDVFGLAQADGSFELANISFGKMLVQITFQGYKPFTKTITFSKENASVNLGDVYMKIQAKELDEVVVTISPIVIKKDTIEYNAGSFKTKPNSVVEDLLKKLPGVEVAKDGTIKAQGESVARVLVDGKRFFGDDPKMATRNLPPDVVDKIQVFDDQSDQSKFTGFDDGNRVKTINITTKKDKRKGYFGRGILAGGYGAEDEGLLMDNSLNLSRYNGTQQMTLMAQANNINKQSFSVRDILGSLGNGGGGGARGTGGGGGLLGSGTGNGITTTLAAGGNYRDNWGKKTEASGSYFFNDQTTANYRSSRSQTIFANNDSTTYTDQVTPSETQNQSHRINFNIESQIDSSNSLVIRPNVSFQNTSSSSTTTSHKEDNKLQPLIYDQNSRSARESDGYNGSIDATFRHRFKKKGRTYSIGINAGGSTNNSNSFNYSENNIVKPLVRYEIVDRNSISSSDGINFSPTISYTEPIAKNQLLEFNYNYAYNKNTLDRQTYNRNTTGKYDMVDTAQTNNFENTYNSNRFTISYRIQGTKYNFSAGSGIQVGELISINNTKKSTIEQHYTNFFPTATFNYNFTRTHSIRAFYNGRTAQPNVNQLQPIVITNDNINYSSGNPDLKQQFTHSLRLLYNKFDIFTQRIVIATINASMVSNDIQNSTTYTNDSVGSVYSRPVNLNGTYSVNGYFNYGFPLKKPKSNLNFSTNISYNQNQNLITNIGKGQTVGTTQSNFTRNTVLSETIGWTTNLKNNFDMNFSSTSTYNISKQSVNTRNNSNFFTQTLSAEATYYTKSGWVVSTDFDYIHNGGLSAGYNASIPLWNASLAKQIFKKKQGEIKFYVFDLLNQNVSVTRTITDNTISDTRNRVLTRYFMVSLTFNLRKFGAGGGQEQRMPALFRNMMRGAGGNMRGGGMN